MSERVVPFEGDVRWEPNAPDAQLNSTDAGRSVLSIAAHPDDDDQRRVVLTWTACSSTEFGAPNDEARHLHRLYERGLAEVLWIGLVLDSSRIDEFARMASQPPTTHYVIPLKECVVEVLATSLKISREGPQTPAQ